MSVPGPNLGPCEAWIDGADVAACPPCDSVGTNTELLDALALEASMALYEISGRRFTGLCTSTVRPCRTDCSCWDVFPFDSDRYWNDLYWGGGWGAGGGWMDWRWRNRRGQECGCDPLSKILLAGYPVRQISEILIDGQVLPADDDNGNPNYEIHGWDTLVRMDDPGPPVVHRKWPSCQNQALEATQPGTFQITYRHGVDPPQLGRDAAAAIACQLFISCGGGTGCKLPAGATRTVRQGVTVDRKVLLAWLSGSDKSTGIVAVDTFLYAYASTGRRRRNAVFSPDLPKFPRRVTG